MNPNRTRSRDAVVGLVAVLLGAFASASPFGQTGQTAADAKSATVRSASSAAVLVELFTSEGCNTCPPADKLLTEFDQTQPVKDARVIALSEHVDYWNHLGWKDPFSSAEFTRRQTEYSRVLGNEDIYTPQMIVDGRAEFVGSKRVTAFEAIAKAARSPKADVKLAFTKSASNSVTLTVELENVPDVSRGDRAEVMLAITESELLSKVSRGENSGRQLAHSAVTRKLIKIGVVEGKAFSAEPTVRLDPTWKRQNMKVVGFVQERNSRRVLGAAAIKLSGDP